MAVAADEKGTAWKMTEDRSRYDQWLALLETLPPERRDALVVRSMPFGDIISSGSGEVHIPAPADLMATAEGTALWRDWAYELCRKAKGLPAPKYKRKSMLFPLPNAVAERWEGLCAALNAAALPYTGKSDLPVPLMCLHDVLGAEAALHRAMDDVRKTIKEKPLDGAFVMTKDGVMCEVSWIVGSTPEPE